MSFSPEIKRELINLLSIDELSLHVANPGSEGLDNEVDTRTYVRQPCQWLPATSAPIRKLADTVEFRGKPSLVLTHVGLWEAGVFVGVLVIQRSLRNSGITHHFPYSFNDEGIFTLDPATTVFRFTDDLELLLTEQRLAIFAESTLNRLLDNIVADQLSLHDLAGNELDHENYERQPVSFLPADKGRRVSSGDVVFRGLPDQRVYQLKFWRQDDGFLVGTALITGDDTFTSDGTYTFPAGQLVLSIQNQSFEVPDLL